MITQLYSINKMFSFSPAIKLESLGSEETTEEVEPQSHASTAACQSVFAGGSLFQSLTQHHHRQLPGADLTAGGSADRRPLAMLQRLGWDAAATFAATAGELGGGGPEVTNTLAVTAERLQADYLQYCLAKESARLFYTRLAAQLQQQPQPPLGPHHKYVFPISNVFVPYCILYMKPEC